MSRGEENVPIICAEEVINLGEDMILLLVGPREATTVEPELLQLQMVKSGAEFPHEAAVDVEVALVGCLRDKIEISEQKPLLSEGRTDGVV